MNSTVLNYIFICIEESVFGDYLCASYMAFGFGDCTFIYT